MQTRSLCEYLMVLFGMWVALKNVNRMKDGGVAEVGTHEELLTKKGEYYKLYTIQASAFLP